MSTSSVWLLTALVLLGDISFYNKDFIDNHPDIELDKKSDSPDEDKSLHDTKASVPVLTDFFEKHPLIQPKTFLGDAAFDNAILYDALLNDLQFEKAFIPLNTRSKLSYPDCSINENGVPTCPYDDTLPMKYEGICSRYASGGSLGFGAPFVFSKSTFDNFIMRTF